MTSDNPVIALDAHLPLILSLSKDTLSLSKQRLSAKQPKPLPTDFTGHGRSATNPYQQTVLNVTSRYRHLTDCPSPAHGRGVRGEGPTHVR
jgi:hypothetical protein